jgi:hypothetical protein
MNQETVVGVCDKCNGVVVRLKTSGGTQCFCKNCGSLPEVKMDKPTFVREDVVSDRTLLIQTPKPGNLIIG